MVTSVESIETEPWTYVDGGGIRPTLFLYLQLILIPISVTDLALNTSRLSSVKPNGALSVGGARMIHLSNYTTLTEEKTLITSLGSLNRLSSVKPNGASGLGGGTEELFHNTHPHGGTTLMTFLHSLPHISYVKRNGALAVGGARRNYSTIPFLMETQHL